MRRLLAGVAGIAVLGAVLSAVPAAAEVWAPSGAQRLAADFDGDGKADLVTWRPSTGAWDVIGSATGSRKTFVYGKDGDVPMPADFTGDGRADATVYRPSTGMFFVLRPDGTQWLQQLGQPGDIPVMGDYDGDKKSDFTVWRPSSAVWISVLSTSGTIAQRQWGATGDTPLSGDYDGDGKADLAVWRDGDTAQWWVLLSRDGRQLTKTYEASYKSPAPAADFDGDGKTDLAVLDTTYDWSWTYYSSRTGAENRMLVPVNLTLVPGDYDGDQKADFAWWKDGQWNIARSSNDLVTQYGQSGDVPFTLDFDGDGKADKAVWRPSNQTWYIYRSGDGGQTIRTYGASGDIPVPADYDGDGKADIATFRPVSGLWGVLKSSDGQADYQWYGGNPGDVPVPGDYDGDKKAERAVWYPAQGRWFMKLTSTGEVRQDQWGANGDKPLFGDVDGDGKSDRIVARREGDTYDTFTVYILQSSNGLQDIRTTPTFGQELEQRVVDVSGDGKADPIRLTWLGWDVLTRPNGAATTQTFSRPDLSADRTAAGDFTGDKRAELAYFHASDGTWHVQKDPDPAKDRITTTQGAAGDIAL